MSHCVESMAYCGQVPWHGLGCELEKGTPLDGWIKAAGLDFTYESSPVCFEQGMEDQSGLFGQYDDFKVLYRSDTHQPLSVVSKRYQVVQPREIVAFYADLTDRFGFEMETAGVLKSGRKVWALAKTGNTFTLKGNDAVSAYLLLATACDGTLATTAQFTSIRVVCNNTLSIALGDTTGHQVKVPHRSVFDPVAVKKQLGLSVSHWDAFMVRMKALSERRITFSEEEKFFEQLMTNAEGKRNDKAIYDLRYLYHGNGKGAQLPSARHTAWGLLNAVTEYVDHHKQARSTDNRLNSAWFGQGAALKNLAREQALALVQ